VRAQGADLCLGFDGDGDRCGVVDDTGREIFADKIGVLLARDLSAQHPNAQFVVDVKSTGLYLTDPVLKERGVKTDYWKTGHSYIKRRTAELKALAGFEKSGHFFFNPPVGHGYDDGIVAGIQVLEMMDRASGKKLSALYDGLPKTFGSPTMAPECPDDKKYAVVDALVKDFSDLAAKGGTLLGQKIVPGRRHLGPGAGVLQQAVFGGGGGKPCVGSEYAGHVCRHRCATLKISGSGRIRPENIGAVFLGPSTRCCYRPSRVLTCFTHAPRVAITLLLGNPAQAPKILTPICFSGCNRCSAGPFAC
jgi:hypothetical protein